MRIPPTNNVYGELVSPDGLRAVAAAIETVLGPGTTSAYRGNRDTETLRLRTDVADFESIPLPGGLEYLFNGAVAGPIEAVIAFVRPLSAALSDAHVEHRLDVHDGNRIVLSLPD